jgi:GntR family transcriptional regulator
MQIMLSKDSDVPLRQQLADQIVALITTGQLRSGERLPSVRSLARRIKIHHNTVSEAYQDLVQRKWLTRSRGSRLVVGAFAARAEALPVSLNALVNETIQRARNMGFSLQELTAHVRERLLAQPPDHILVVEDEAGMRELICREVQNQIAFPVRSCALAEFVADPSLAVGAQVFAPSHVVDKMTREGRLRLPAVAITYSEVAAYVELVRKLREPSVVAAVSISESVLKTARGVFAPAIGRRHTFRECLVRTGGSAELAGVDLAFCDSATIAMAGKVRNVHYRLVAGDSLEGLATSLGLQPRREKKASSLTRRKSAPRN